MVAPCPQWHGEVEECQRLRADERQHRGVNVDVVNTLELLESQPSRQRTFFVIAIPHNYEKRCNSDRDDSMHLM
jgi:hypothetical protein